MISSDKDKIRGKSAGKREKKRAERTGRTPPAVLFPQTLALSLLAPLATKGGAEGESFSVAGLVIALIIAAAVILLVILLVPPSGGRRR